MSADPLGREVNRLYWKTDEPVTRLAAQLGVSRGTFYNHMQPLPAGSDCPACGGTLFFRTRSNRDAGEATCADCERVESIAAPAPPRSRAPRKGGAGTKARVLRAEPGGPESDVPESRAPLLGWAQADDWRRTQLLAVAVGAAVLGVGILIYSRHRS